MISTEDAPHTYEYDDYYKILPAIHNWSLDPQRIANGQRVQKDFVYCSNINNDWMTIEYLRDWILANQEKIGKI
jgi:hypothetical protein